MQKEINKYLKLISSGKLKKNFSQCIELYNVVGGLYSEIGSYDEACHYHEEAYKLCKTIGDRSLTMVTFRYIGEAKASLGEYHQAVDYIKKYLELAEKLNEKVELQRAWTTLGRVYLMQAQDLREQKAVDKQTKELAREAEKKFQTALTLAESVKDQVNDKEHAQMISGLLMNLGLIKDICGQHQEAVIKFNRAIETCRLARIKEDLYRAQIILAGIYRQRYEVKSAVRLSEDALQTAKSIGKKLLVCEALIERGLVRLCQRDFKNAKRTFVQAYLEKSPNEEDHSKAIRLTKLSHLIVENYERICKGETGVEQKWRCCDKLGDLFIAVGNYKLAVEFYRRAFSDAKVAQKSKVELARILYSIAETYADDGQYQQALLCYEKELSYRSGQPNEQCQSLIKIAYMLEYLEKEPEQVAEAYERALDKAGKEPKLIHQVLKYYVPYMKQKSFNATRYRELNELLTNVKSYPEVVDEIENEDQEEAGDELEDEVANVDDIITDDEDNDEVLMIGGRRKVPGAHSKFKPNEVGDTPLHEASIKGDLKRVKSLIAQGHDINPRDNAGWIPLHEACNHGHYNVAEVLISNGADVNNRGLKGVSPLHDAATNGHFNIMRLLIKNGANVIALTDTGETVLNCLRDYKKRNFKDFSNRDMTEFQLMEVELLNAMDKCGFDLMTISTNSTVNKASTRSGAHTSQRKLTTMSHDTKQTDISPAKKTNRNNDTLRERNQAARTSLDPLGIQPGCSNSIQDYRRTIQTLKRKRSPLDVSEPVQKKSQPATLVGGHGSISTKQWLAADDHEEFEEEDDEDDSLKRQTSVRNNTKAKAQILDDDDDEDIVILDEKTTRDAQSRRTKTRRRSPDLWDAPLASPTLDLKHPTRTPSPLGSPDLGFDAVNNISNDDLFANNTSQSNSRQSRHLSSTPSNLSDSNHFSLDAQPLSVLIDGRRLLVPIEGVCTTIKDLKESIANRYSILTHVRPNIRLAPMSKPNFLLFDGDLCKDVIREGEFLAEIESWNLNSIEKTYCDECSKANLNPLTYVKIELRALDEGLEARGCSGSTSTKLYWAHVRLPRSHIRPILVALSRRSFQSANFQGSPQLLECPMIAQDLLMNSCILTWKNLTRLSLQCTGLLRSQFEFFCSGGTKQNSCSIAAQYSTIEPAVASACKAKLPELTLLDVSFNSIAYKSEQEFLDQLKSLLQVVCPKLKRLDVRRNHLQFVKKTLFASAEGCDASVAQPALGPMQVELPPDIEILMADQYDEYLFYNSSAEV